MPCYKRLFFNVKIPHTGESASSPASLPKRHGQCGDSIYREGGMKEQEMAIERSLLGQCIFCGEKILDIAGNANQDGIESINYLGFPVFIHSRHNFLPKQ